MGLKFVDGNVLGYGFQAVLCAGVPSNRHTNQENGSAYA